MGRQQVFQAGRLAPTRATDTASEFPGYRASSYSDETHSLPDAPGRSAPRSTGLTEAPATLPRVPHCSILRTPRNLRCAAISMALRGYRLNLPARIGMFPVPRRRVYSVLCSISRTSRSRASACPKRRQTAALEMPKRPSIECGGLAPLWTGEARLAVGIMGPPVFQGRIVPTPPCGHPSKEGTIIAGFR